MCWVRGIVANDRILFVIASICENHIASATSCANGRRLSISVISAIDVAITSTVRVLQTESLCSFVTFYTQSCSVFFASKFRT